MIKAAAETKGTAEIAVPDSPAELAILKFTRLEGVSALKTCDRCPSVYAVVEIMRADWKSTLLFCGNCARKLGYEHTQKGPAKA